MLVGIRVPFGFAVSAKAYRRFLDHANLSQQINELSKWLENKENLHKHEALAQKAEQLREAIRKSTLPSEVEAEVLSAYENLCKREGVENLPVAVRSSATAEDLPGTSFAGQYETILNVRGKSHLLSALKECYASVFVHRAICYRAEFGFEQNSIALAVGIQRMVDAGNACSGVMFTLDTETGFDKVVFLTASYGLGENVVQGHVNPDEYYVFKESLETAPCPIIQKTIGSKDTKMIYAASENGPNGTLSKNPTTKIVPVPKEYRERFALENEEILQLAKWAVRIQRHYSQIVYDNAVQMDIEWAKDAVTGELFLVQARPETAHSTKRNKIANVFENYYLKTDESKLVTLITGRAIGSKMASGKAQIIQSTKDIRVFVPGNILVTEMTDPDWEPVMKTAAAIVTNKGGRTCHAAIVCREIGIPAIVGTDKGTKVIKDGEDITVSCAGGEVGKVYQGKLEFVCEKMEIPNEIRPRTKIMMNLANPSEAFKMSRIPNDGVGLAREEFIINNYIGIHPLALLYYDQQDEEVKRIIDKKTVGYKDKAQFFVEKLAFGIAMLATAFYPNDIIVRLSDFKTNEYGNLVGGTAYEPEEHNPMIGFRGASRYYDPRYKEGFILECKALKRVRDEMGLKNVKIMIPFCRTVEEGIRVQELMASQGLKRGENGLELYVMCEIPSNVIMADLFAKIFDGFSIGSNDLTSLVLGLDRDNEIIAHLYDERNPAVLKMIQQVISEAHHAKRKVGICGQGPSDYPDFAEFLVRQGIDSLSLTPDVIPKTTLRILELESKMGLEPRKLEVLEP
ncbi:Phosphoenolpyruvate synthase [Galdieria sulphuraria]|nr:Phosphoenolpyruvate synthase [Galdieria sulphuraria]